MNKFKIFDKLNIKQPENFDTNEDWFGYFINDYIPDQGEEDMFKFLELGMSPISYVMWKAVEENILDDEFADEVEVALKERIKAIEEAEQKEIGVGKDEKDM